MKYLRRLIWFVASRLMIILIVLGLLTTAFYFSMNASNIHIILKDGMAKRAQKVLMNAEENLDVYFSPAYQDRDPLLLEVKNNTSIYQNFYDITGIDHRIQLDSFWCWPWDNTATATITETIPGIDGKLKSGVRNTEIGATLPQTPRWETMRYNVILTRENNQWRIKDLSPIR